MKRLGNQAQRTSKQMSVFGTSVKDARKFNMGALQQAGYQVGDFAVQVANGTNKMQAFGQQAPQFLQIFGPIGSVVGAAVAVFAAISVAFQKSQVSVDTLGKALDKASQSISSFNSTAVGTLNSTAILSQQYGDLADQAREFFEVQNEINKLTAFRDVATAIQMATASFGEFGDRNIGVLQDTGDRLDFLRGKLKDLSEKGEASRLFDPTRTLARQIEDINNQLAMLSDNGVAKLSNELGISGFMAAELAKEIANAQRAENIDDRVAGLIKVRELYRDIVMADGEITEAEQAQLEVLLKAQGSYLQISKTVDEINSSGSKQVALTDAQNALAVRQGQHYQALNDLLVMRNAGIGEAIKGELKITDEQELQVANLARLGAGYQALNDALVMRNALEGTFTKSQVKGGRGGDPREFAPDYFAFLKEIAKQNEEIARRNAELDEKRRAELEKMAKIPDPLGDLQERTKLNSDLLHVTEARRQVMEAIFQSERNYTPQQIDDTVKQIEAYSKQVKEMERIKQTADMIGDAFENAFMSMIDGTKSAKDAFKDLTRSIIADLYRQYVVKQITGFITQAVGGFMAGPVQGPNLPSANGGGYTGNGARAGGLDGRGGFMAMLHPRETIVDHTKGQGSGTVVHQTFNFSANGDDSVKQIIAQAAPTIAKMAQQGIMDARRRGGQVKQVFG